ncbi:MAG: nuclease-related domain-containing protein [Chthoniobacteraceae bacterium]
MVVKQKGSIEPAIEELLRLLTVVSTKKQRDLIEDEIHALRSGASGEKQAAYHIDFELGNVPGYAIIHDLRIEHNGRVAQIDHLIIGRFLDIFVIESKNFSTSIRICDGDEFQVRARYGWKGIQSPVEQNKRHISVLSDLIRETAVIPRKLGFQFAPKFHNWILVAPECNIAGRKDDHTIMKMDMFGARMQKFRESNVPWSDIAKMISCETLVEVAEKLVSHHTQGSIDYTAKFGIGPQETGPGRTSLLQEEPPVQCATCGVALESKVITYCRLNKKRLGGQFLCQKCQGYAPLESCSACGTSVESNVVAFCRFNSKKFQKRILCRSCQATVG